MLRTLTLIIVIIYLFSIGCAAPARQVGTNSSSSKNKPAWIDNHLSSSTYFIGFGKASITTNTSGAQEQARMNALTDISQQIEVTIISDIKSSDFYVTENNKAVVDESVFKKNIQTLSRAVLQDWEVQATWNGPDGYSYCKVSLEKKKYYDRINKKVNDAIALAVDAMVASEQGPFDARLLELYKGLTALDDFLGNAMRATIGGKEVILNNELPRRLQQLLSSVEIQPVINSVNLVATAPVPDTLGARVYINGKQDRTVTLSWTASNSEVALTPMPVQPDGLYPVQIKALSASAGMVLFTAEIDCGQLSYNLRQKKFKLPAGSFALSRKAPGIYCTETNSFSKKLLEKLTSTAAVSAAPSRSEADYVLSSQCSPIEEVVLDRGIYRAKASLSVTLATAEGKRILDISNEEVSAADPQTGTRAQANAEKVALDKAVKRVNGAF